jgi:hypothetical protein
VIASGSRKEYLAGLDRLGVGRATADRELGAGEAGTREQSSRVDRRGRFPRRAIDEPSRHGIRLLAGRRDRVLVEQASCRSVVSRWTSQAHEVGSAVRGIFIVHEEKLKPDPDRAEAAVLRKSIILAKPPEFPG